MTKINFTFYDGQLKNISTYSISISDGKNNEFFKKLIDLLQFFPKQSYVLIVEAEKDQTLSKNNYINSIFFNLLNDFKYDSIFTLNFV